jgi:hypothetical protein
VEEIVNKRRIAISLLLCAATAGPASAASPFSKMSGDRLMHKASNIVLPSRVGLFQRLDPKPFDDAGRDVGIGYDLDHLVRGDVYIYPVGTPGYGQDLSSEFQVQQNAIRKLNKDVQLISRENTRINQNGRAISGVHANYNLRRNLFAERNLKCGSQLYIFRDGEWFVAYRFSYPRDKSSITLQHIANFIAQWKWKEG